MDTLITQEGWKCTDPDFFQYIRKVEATKFECKEFSHHLLNGACAGTMTYIKDKEKLSTDSFISKYWKKDTLWIEDTVDLEDYTEEAIREVLSTYGYEYEGGEIVDSSGHAYKDNGLIAECIFELETQY